MGFVLKPKIILAIGLSFCGASCKRASTPAGEKVGSSTTQGQKDPPASVKTLEISDDNAQLLGQIDQYTNLEVLSINCMENLRALPESIGTLATLRELNMDNGNGCAMNPQLPESIGNLISLRTLVLYGAQDSREVGDVLARPSSQHKFPSSMSNLKNLVELNLGRNGIQEIPDFVGNLPKLEKLYFGWNMKLNSVPIFLTRLKELKTLNLESDDLSDLPDFLNRLPNLKEIDLGNNCEITKSKKKMDDLKKRFPRVKFNFDDEYDC